jgi:hypothetical protein
LTHVSPVRPVTFDEVPAQERKGARDRGVAGATLQRLPWPLVVLAGAYGILVRLWLLAHLPLFGDEAVVGLMGRGILHGHLDAFYWGQSYGGVEPYVVAAVLSRVNGGPMGLNATAAVLSLAAAVLVCAVLVTGRVSRRLAALGAALTWVWPYAAVWNSVREIGFRGVTLCCGLLLILCAVRVQRGLAGPATRLLLGLAAGVGWWASPEIVYFALPTVVLLLAGWDRLWRPASTEDATAEAGAQRRWSMPWRVTPPMLTVVGLVVGALPWLNANRRSHVASLRAATVAPPGFGYPKRLSLFFHDVLPTQLGLRGVPGGAWVSSPTVGRSVYAAALVLIVLLLARAAWMARLGRRSAPLLAAGAAVVAFPFLSAIFPTSWYTADGRYGVYLVPLLVLLAIWALPSTDPVPATVRPAAHHAAPRRSRPRLAVGIGIAAASLTLIAGTVSTAVLAHESAGVPTHPRAFFTGWSDPNAAARQVIAGLEAHHIRAAYGDYWTAYTLDFLAPGAVSVTPSPLDQQRSAALAGTVRQAARPAWLFFAPTQIAAAGSAFSNPEPGPGGYTQAAFIDYLKMRHVAYGVVDLGVLNAVIPDRPVRHLPPLG